MATKFRVGHVEAGADGLVATLHFHDDDTHMTVQFNENNTPENLKMAVGNLLEAIEVAVTLRMLNVVGDITVEDTPALAHTVYQCRICERLTVDGDYEGWHLPSGPHMSTYCPDHAPNPGL